MGLRPVLSSGPPPASASLVLLADRFWLASHTGLVFHIGGEAALPWRQELAQRGRRPGHVRSRDPASVALLWGCGSVVSPQSRAAALVSCARGVWLVIGVLALFVTVR